MHQPQTFVAYFRVSTQRQGASGLGIEAQRLAVSRYLAERSQTALGEFVETETGKGANALEKRPQLRSVRIPRDGGHDSMLMADSVPA